MLNTLRLSLSLRNTYRVNSILYSLKQIPLLGQILPENLYRISGLKRFANSLFTLWKIASAFLWKFLYLLVLVYSVGPFYDPVPASLTFLHILLFLTLVGSYLNNHLFIPRRERYYALTFLRMNARSYTLVNYGYSLVEDMIGLLPFTVLFGQSCDIPLWLCLLLPFCMAGMKLAVTAYCLFDGEKSGFSRSETRLQRSAWVATALLLAIAYFPPVLALVLPFPVITAVWLIWIPIGFVCARWMIAFPHYDAFNRALLSKVVTQTDRPAKNAKSAAEDLILVDSSAVSKKIGFEYLNDLFIQRHRKILWRSSIRIACTCVVLCCIVLSIMALIPDTRLYVNLAVLEILPCFSFILYLINRGGTFTSALFMNCDHSLLTYPFYKQPDSVLRLFKIRLREIIKINLLPAFVLGIGLCSILYASGGTKNSVNYAILFISIVSMSLFFSIHHLTIYYLLQPYTVGTETRSGTYRVVMFLTSAVCYALISARLPILLFGTICILFCILYSIIACLLVYKIAPKTFRLRS